MWLQEFPLLVCQISSCHATSVPAPAFCKHALTTLLAAWRKTLARERTIKLVVVGGFAPTAVYKARNLDTAALEAMKDPDSHITFHEPRFQFEEVSFRSGRSSSYAKLNVNELCG